MVAFLKKLIPREDKFFDMFEAHAASSLAAAQILADILKAWLARHKPLMASSFNMSRP